MLFITLHYIILGNPTRLAPIPKPAPDLADEPIDGIYVSRILNVAAAVSAMRVTSSKEIERLGITNAAIATIKPSTRYFIARVINSDTSKSKPIILLLKKIIYIKNNLNTILYFIKMTNNSNNKVERKSNTDGTPNSKYVDVLDEDKPIAGQKFTCISFISPESIIKKRELYFFEQFVKQWEPTKSVDKFAQFLHFLSYKYSLSFDVLNADFVDFCKDENGRLVVTSVPDDYKNFVDAHETKLEERYNSEHNFQTSVRGVKVRGAFPTQEEAEMRCKMLREVDPNHDVYVGPVGMWLPVHPEAYKTGRVEYMEEDLNQLMQEKTKNEASAKVEFDKRVRETKEKAMEDNKKKAIESGNVLSQTINEQGNLVSIKDMNTTEKSLTSEATVSDIRRELFQNPNVVLDKNTDHGFARLPTSAVDGITISTVSSSLESVD